MYYFRCVTLCKIYFFASLNTNTSPVPRTIFSVHVIFFPASGSPSNAMLHVRLSPTLRFCSRGSLVAIVI